LKVILADLRMIKPVDDVEHRRLAGAVGPDDRADLTLVNVEADILDRLHAAERQDTSRTSSITSGCAVVAGLVSARATATFILLPP
jgi:hypothetical protein